MDTEPNLNSNKISSRATPKQMVKKQPSLDLLKDNRSITIEQIKKVLQRDKTDAKTTLKNKIQQPK
jgi:predicted transcriptional regulator